jgi:hypothetical protein
MNHTWTRAILAAGLVLGAAERASAHGLAGKRFFPATLATEDPFVADELSLPTVATFREPASGDEPSTRETEISVELAKRITPKLGVSIEDAWVYRDPDGWPTQEGLSNLALGVKYQLLRNDSHEGILSAGFEWEIGGTGAQRVEADSFSTLGPALYAGKGLGDLPDALRYLRPLAVTGVAALAIPTRAGTRTVTAQIETEDEGPPQFALDVEREWHPTVFEWGIAVEYSLPYLQSFVKDIGLRRPFDRMIPVVEFPLETPVDRGATGETTGTVNPGLIWAGRRFQLGIEAMIPLNARTGHNVGILGQVHFYVDDLFPKTLGRPIFGGKP